MVVKLKYEFYIPTSYNDKTPIEPKKQRYVKNKIVDKFNGISIHPATVQGIWCGQNKEVFHYDNCIHFEVCVDNLDENEIFFEQLKEELKELFRQEDIYMICFEVKML
ncbi:MAG: hypothetical protein AABX98_03150 [Nanoarchaeota archaeon]